MSRRLASAGSRASGEQGFTLTEMVIVLTILGVVLSALMAVFVSALRTEVDQNRRFEAQQDARLAIGKLRREIHCAQLADVAPTGDSVTLTNGSSATTGYCPGGQTTWCTAPSGAGFGLHRAAGLDCGPSAALVAQNLVDGQIFTFVHREQSRMQVGVDVRVDVDRTDSAPPYRLFDEIVLRGSERNG